MAVVTIPYTPRTLQSVIHDGMDAHRFGVVVCHRRFGKTVCAINHLLRAALVDTKRQPRYAYITDTFAHAKDIAWEYVKFYAGVVPDMTINESELRVDFPNAARLRLYGSEDPDRFRGLYFDGIVLDEYGKMPPRTYTEILRPTLADRRGWALFMGTPNGKNQFYDIIHGDTKTGFVGAKHDPDWFFAEYKASETGVVAAEELADSRRDMTQDEYDQEYECSFEASVKGAVFARDLLAAREGNRVTRVPYDPSLPVDTDWDLGMGDATAIWFSQSLRSREIRLIDYYENTGLGLAHYKKILDDKPYTYGSHWAPHDIAVREFGSGNSRLQAAHDLGLHFQVVPRQDHLEDGIHAARMIFPRCWFDSEHCARGIEALQNYRWKQSRVQDPTGKPLPVHDWASHGADAFRGLAFRHYTNTKNPEKQAQAEVRKAQRDDRDVFRWQRAVGARRGGY